MHCFSFLEIFWTLENENRTFVHWNSTMMIYGKRRISIVILCILANAQMLSVEILWISVNEMMRLAVISSALERGNVAFNYFIIHIKSLMLHLLFFDHVKSVLPLFVGWWRKWPMIERAKRIYRPLDEFHYSKRYTIPPLKFS